MKANMMTSRPRLSGSDPVKSVAPSGAAAEEVELLTIKLEPYLSTCVPWNNISLILSFAIGLWAPHIRHIWLKCIFKYSSTESLMERKWWSKEAGVNNVGTKLPASLPNVEVISCLSSNSPFCWWWILPLEASAICHLQINKLQTQDIDAVRPEHWIRTMSIQYIPRWPKDFRRAGVLHPEAPRDSQGPGNLSVLGGCISNTSLLSRVYGHSLSIT